MGTYAYTCTDFLTFMDLFGSYGYFIGFIHIGIIHNYIPNFTNFKDLTSTNFLTSTSFYRPATVLLG